MPSNPQAWMCLQKSSTPLLSIKIRVVFSRLLPLHHLCLSHIGTTSTMIMSMFLRETATVEQVCVDRSSDPVVQSQGSSVTTFCDAQTP
jgi:hypothetical protein